METRVRMYRWLVCRALTFTAVATPVMWGLFAADGIWLPVLPLLIGAQVGHVAAASYYCWRFLPRYPVLLRRTVRGWAERHHPW
jgi:hypothetical protein